LQAQILAIQAPGSPATAFVARMQQFEMIWAF
jgi:hypothetical protein